MFEEDKEQEAKDTARVSSLLHDLSPSAICSVLAYGLTLLTTSDDEDMDKILEKVREFQKDIPEGLQAQARSSYRLAMMLRAAGLDIPKGSTVLKVEEDVKPEDLTNAKVDKNEMERVFDRMMADGKIKECTDEEVFIPLIEKDKPKKKGGEKDGEKDV